jgi:hypothetical protein
VLRFGAHGVDEYRIQYQGRIVLNKLCHRVLNFYYLMTNDSKQGTTAVSCARLALFCALQPMLGCFAIFPGDPDNFTSLQRINC